MEGRGDGEGRGGKNERVENVRSDGSVRRESVLDGSPERPVKLVSVSSCRQWVSSSFSIQDPRSNLEIEIVE